MNIQLSSEIRSTMKEKKILTLTSSRKTKLNLLVVGSDLSFPLYIIRLNRKEVLKTYDKMESLRTFKSYAYGIVDSFNELSLTVESLQENAILCANL